MVDYAVEDQSERPGWRRTGEVVGNAALASSTKASVSGARSRRWIDITRSAGTWRVRMGNIGLSSSLRMAWMWRIRNLRLPGRASSSIRCRRGGQRLAAVPVEIGEQQPDPGQAHVRAAQHADEPGPAD